MAIDVRSLPFPINVVSVVPGEGYTLNLRFEVGADKEAITGLFDMRPYLDLPAFSHLTDREEFDKAFSDGVTVCWPGDVDIAPERLYTDCLGR